MVITMDKGKNFIVVLEIQAIYYMNKNYIVIDGCYGWDTPKVDSLINKKYISYNDWSYYGKKSKI